MVEEIPHAVFIIGLDEVPHAVGRQRPLDGLSSHELAFLAAQARYQD
jgi:hypothetical protein